jgi:hypothetical protein
MARKEVPMTRIQIDRNNWLETRRHQQASEAEQARHDAEVERLTGEANAEAARANRAREQYNIAALEESKRASMARESLTASQISEAVRSDMARETEAFRHNKQAERIDSFIARNQNTREWKKLSLTEQANEYSNAYTAAQTLATNYDTFIRKYKHELGFEDAEYSKILQTISSEKQKVALAWSEFQQARKIGDAKLEMEKKESFAKRVKTWADIFNNSTSNTVDNAAGIIGIVTKFIK